MAYSLETSSVKTIVPGAEVSGFCDVVARQKINELSGEVPQLSAGEGIDISTVDGKTVITNNISAGSNISLVYDMETNTYRIDGQAGVDPASAVFSESAQMPTLGLSYTSGVKISGGDETLYHKTIASFNTYISAVSLNGPYVTYLTGDSDVPTDLHPVTSEHWNNIITATKEVSDNGWNWNNTFNTVTANSASWGGGSELPSAISAWSFNNFSQSYSHTPGALFTETYTGSLFAPSSQWGGGPDSKPKLLLDTTVENYSGTSWVYEHGITSTGHRTTRLEDNMLYINSAIESDTIAGQVYTMVEPDFIRLFGSKPNETTKLIELGSSGVARSTTESATWSQIISAANAGGGDAFPIVSSDDSTPNYKFIYELDGTASGIEASYTKSAQYDTDWVSSTLVSPTEIKSVILNDGGYTATGFSLTPNGVSASGGWPLPRYKSWTDLTKPTIQWSDAAPDVTSVYGSGALLNLKRNGLIAVLSNSGLQLGAETGTYDKFSGVYINGKGVSSKNAFGLFTYNQYATWEQILNAATGSQGHTYTGVAPIQVNNTTDEISITGESLSAGPGIDMFSSGGYVVISSNGGNPFPITGTNGTTGFTANMDCSSMMLTTGASPAGGYVKQTVRGVQYEAYPATDVSASWYNIINGANNRSNCYCIRFTNEMTAASLEDYSAYDKVTVVHSNQYTPNCMLYWNGNTKVFPSGLYCELVKGTNDQNQTDWFFTTSGWINNVEWDWD